MAVSKRIRTDLALETTERFKEENTEIRGVEIQEDYDEEKDVRTTVVRIVTENGAKAMGRPQGTYITIEAPDLSVPDEDYHREISEEISKHLKQLIDLKKEKSILVVGLGNAGITADALGPHVVENLRMTRHIIREYGLRGIDHEKMHRVSGIVPGVMAQTGMETAEIIQGVVAETKPDVVVAIDALAARSVRRLNRTIQITDTGIHPGSGVSKIVIGRSSATKRHLLSKPTLTEKLIDYAPNLDVHIIPDTVSNAAVYQLRGGRKKNHIVFSVTDTLKSTSILILSSLVGMIFQKFGFDEANIITVFVLGVLATAVITNHQIYSLISSIVSVLVFNFLFTEPQFTLQAYDQGYPVTFIIMFLAAFLTGSLAIRIKNQAKQAAQSAYRTKVLFDTNQLLQQAKDKNEIVSATSNQLIKLLGKDIVFYLADGEVLDTPHIFSVTEENLESCISENEKAVAGWVLKNNKRAGATTGTLSNAKCLYLAVRSSSMVYGVIGIVMGEIPLDPFENSILLSILGECALALENEKNAREKQEAAILAKNEQLRANLLRAISHDLRTPLTSISGNASNLLSNSDSFDNDTKKQLYMDIYDDSMWLINLVENLLAVTRIEEGRLNLHITEDLMEDVITEALHHINRKSEEHHISVESKEEFLLAKMDAKLIVQVIINIVDNAIKYTPKNSHIVIRTEKRGKQAIVSISDDGNGIADEIKPRIFDMFYSGANQIADSRRSLGLGLSLCKSIINAHGGELTVSDNLPHGTVFTFTLPAGEVKVYE